jgi:hypothetical protein
VAKVINVSNKPYEFTFDGGNYGPIQPGEIKDYPNEVAAHCIKRSEILDPELGETVGYKMAYLDSLSKDKIKEIATYICPFVAANQCHAKPFKTIDDLRRHMDDHWGSDESESKSTGKAKSSFLR